MFWSSVDFEIEPVRFASGLVQRGTERRVLKTELNCFHSKGDAIYCDGE